MGARPVAGGCLPLARIGRQLVYNGIKPDFSFSLPPSFFCHDEDDLNSSTCRVCGVTFDSDAASDSFLKQ
jgi:hypothetical protein